MTFQDFKHILDSYKINYPNFIYFLKQKGSGEELDFSSINITLTIFFTYDFVKIYLSVNTYTKDFLVQVNSSNVITDTETQFEYPFHDDSDFKTFMNYLIHTYYSEKEPAKGLNEPLPF